MGSAVREPINTMDLRKMGTLFEWEVDGTGSGWCSMAALVLVVLQFLVPQN